MPTSVERAISPFHLRNRKAISPVLATVILIAITLIAAIAIAGFVSASSGRLRQQRK